MSGRPLRAWLCLAMLVWMMSLGLAAHAAAPAPERSAVDGDSLIQNVTWDVTADGAVTLDVNMTLALPQVVEEALVQGIPIYFVAEAGLERTRFWWWSRQDGLARRYWRVSYQPLTRMWRVQSSVISSEHTDQARGLSQGYGSLSQALGSMQRINGWRIVEARALKPHASYEAFFHFGLDKSRLPRPLQIGSVGRSDWDLQLGDSQVLQLP
ncbi:DUF4390 domain-containing protein [Corticibacter populi]|uniref:DUF4390 domain-containing protein n=1 Tax=Corticibacter populi TaxID=1550736 RepID=UPI0013C31B17|nr:DUF4390 domain-containing protein [Corticibacter populi]